jgi:hypothetical protein
MLPYQLVAQDNKSNILSFVSVVLSLWWSPRNLDLPKNVFATRTSFDAGSIWVNALGPSRKFGLSPDSYSKFQ